MVSSLDHVKQLFTDRLYGDDRNKRVGDFLYYRFTEERQERIIFQNECGDRISYGGMRQVEVRILIKQSSHDRLERGCCMYTCKSLFVDMVERFML